MDFSKYDPLKANRPVKEDPEAGFTAADYDAHASAPGRSEPWMASTPVILLIEYLRKHHDQGIILYERYGSFHLKFNPGLNAADLKNGRATIAMNAFKLLHDATDDLKDMITAGIELPLMVKRSPEKVGGRV